MITRRWVRLLALYLTFVLALLGFAAFLAGVVVEFFARGDPLQGNLSPVIQIALVGLCIAAAMSVIWFTIIGWMLVRQRRAQGVYYADAYRLMEAFRFGEAIPLLERSVREGKETSEVLMLLTSAYAYTGQLAKAQATADRAVQLFPNDPSAYMTLANGYRLQASYEAAARALMQAAALAPENPVIWAELGFAQHFAGDTDAAVESFKTSAAYQLPDTYGVRVYHHLVQAYKQRGDADEAARAAARMVSARRGLDVWKTGLTALDGTAYGQALRYEIAEIERGLSDADAGRNRPTDTD
jgi:tetratricopeptide (TPR) repeat protein